MTPNPTKRVGDFAARSPSRGTRYVVHMPEGEVEMV